MARLKETDTPLPIDISCLVSSSVSSAAVALLSDGKLDTLALGEGDPGLLSTDDENVALTGSERVVNGVLEVDNVEASIVTLTVGDDANTTHVTTTSDHGNSASVELDVVLDLASGEVNLDGIVDLDRGVREADSPSIVRDQEWDSTTTKLNSLDLGELVLSLLGLDTVDGEAALGVVDETEVLASLLNGDDVHEASGEGDVGSDLVVDLDETLHHDGLGLTVVEGISQSVSNENDERKALASLVGTSAGLGSIGSAELVEHPSAGSAQSLLVLLDSTGHFVCWVLVMGLVELKFRG